MVDETLVFEIGDQVAISRVEKPNAGLSPVQGHVDHPS